jgi:hypothetical protein
VGALGFCRSSGWCRGGVLGGGYTRREKVPSPWTSLRAELGEEPVGSVGGRREGAREMRKKEACGRWMRVSERQGKWRVCVTLSTYMRGL